MSTMPLAGRIMDNRGPGLVVLVGITLIATGIGTFAYGVSQHHACLPTLLIGLAVMGMGCTMMPVSGSAVQTLLPNQVARGSTLINVNQQVAGSIGTALMSVILTNQVNHSAYIAAASKMAALQEEAAKRGVPPDPSQFPPQALTPDFMSHVTNDVAHAYAVVFVVAVCLVLATLIPASFLPKKPAAARPVEPMTPVLAHYSLNNIRAMRSTVSIGSLAATGSGTALLSHSIAKPCTNDHAASSAPAGSTIACGSVSVPTPWDSSLPAAAWAAASSGSPGSTSERSNITA